MNFKQINKGFTLIEILVVMAITTVILAIVINSFYNVAKIQALDKDYISVAALIDQAKSMSINSKQGSKYGIYFASSTVTLFKGNSYETGVVNQIYSLNNKTNISAINLISSSTSQIVFERINGYANASGTVAISLKTDPLSAKIIKVYRTGVIEYK